MPPTLSELQPLRDAYRQDKATLLASLQSRGRPPAACAPCSASSPPSPTGCCAPCGSGPACRTAWRCWPGGYGRAQLFPYSDVDVLVLLPDGSEADCEGPLRPAIEAFIGRFAGTPGWKSAPACAPWPSA